MGHLIDIMKMNAAATIAIMDGTMMKEDITMITTTTEEVVAEDDEDHPHLLDYPNQKFHQHSLAPIANWVSSSFRLELYLQFWVLHSSSTKHLCVWGICSL